MENTSKALLISAAILILILIITVGIKIVSTTKGIDATAKQTGDAIGNVIRNATGTVIEKIKGGKVVTGQNGGNVGQGEQNPNIATYEDGVPIPVGFRYVEGTKDTGLVVKNEADGSEFVWVPVTENIVAYGLDDIWNDYREPDVITKIWDSNSKSWVDGADNNKEYLNIINNILGTKYNNSNDFLITLQNDFNAMAESVHRNQGFYVGRYETSLKGRRAQVLRNQKSATPEESSANRWYGLYAYQKKYSTNSVQGSMIWGSQYDAMIKWMGNVAEITIGNKKNKTRITGSDPDDVIRNVYDLYGNSFEWTLEANRDYRVARGGGYDDRDFAPKSKGYAR